jgi:hypothetical protein
MHRALAVVGLIMIALIVVGELFSRFYLGLGDPPLSMTDPEIEYLFKPNQRCHRFGNLITYNAYSMRGTPEFPKKKTDPNELRVLVIGDSVVNGGALTDDSKLATTLLSTRLRTEFGRPTIVANISAGSWGPPNEYAYVKRFGLFEADQVFVVLNSGDYADAPTFAPTVGVLPSFPAHKPWSAIGEGFTRYLLPKISPQTPNPNETGRPTTQPGATDIKKCRSALAGLIQLCRANGTRITVIQYPSRTELSGEREREREVGYEVIRSVATESGADVVDVAPAFRAAANSGVSLYRDDIHPNEAGQTLLADGLFEAMSNRSPTSKRSTLSPP